MKKYISIILTIITIFAAIIVFIHHHNTPPPMQKRTRFMMDTFCSITIPGNKAVLPIIDKALDRMQDIDTRFNVNNPESQLYRFANENIPITDNEIVDVIKKALYICEKSNGAKDITLYPISKLWGFYSGTPRLPADADIQKARRNIGYKYIVIDHGTVKKTNPGIAIDLGSIAKGYAISEAAKVLRKGGIKSAIIDGGGQIYALGLYNGKPWKIGIKHPREEGKYIGSLEVTDMSIATSGDYERFFIKDGVRYHHLMDAKTGYPAQGVMCATIVNPDPTMADDLTSAVFVSGIERGLALVKTMPDTETIMMDSNGKLHYSEGLKNNLKVHKIKN